MYKVPLLEIQEHRVDLICSTFITLLISVPESSLILCLQILIPIHLFASRADSPCSEFSLHFVSNILYEEPGKHLPYFLLKYVEDRRLHHLQ